MPTQEYREYRKACLKEFAKHKIVRVLREDGVVSCDHPVTARKRDDGYRATVGKESIQFARLAYMAINGTFVRGKKGLEYHHICGNRFCCRPDHIRKGKDGDNSGRHHCLGYVRYHDEEVGEDLYLKVCPHDPPCRIVSDYADVEATPDTIGENGSTPGCPGFVSYKGMLIWACRHDVHCSHKVELDPANVFRKENVDPPLIVAKKKDLPKYKAKEVTPDKLEELLAKNAKKQESKKRACTKNGSEKETKKTRK